MAAARLIFQVEIPVSLEHEGEWVVARKAIGVIDRGVAPTRAQQPGIRAELTRRWIADLLDAHLRGSGVSLEEARLAIRDLGE